MKKKRPWMKKTNEQKTSLDEKKMKKKNIP